MLIANSALQWCHLRQSRQQELSRTYQPANPSGLLCITSTGMGCSASHSEAELCKTDARVLLLQEHVREETFDEAAKQEAEFFSYIATSYKHYLNGDDEACERVDGQQRQSFRDRAEAAQRQVQELDQVQPPKAVLCRRLQLSAPLQGGPLSLRRELDGLLQAILGGMCRGDQ